MRTREDVRGARRDPGLVVLEGFHAVKHAVRFGAELLGVWTADAAELAALSARLAPDVALAPTVVEVERARGGGPARAGRRGRAAAAQPDPDGIVALPDRRR